ncbi:MAG: Ribosomal protein L5 [Candidatus Methanohalarchaeum thermophilum]|uniref:Large ribosomal subunit protein uL5 n=1 Tax=Methanohalarchaeum thermophilum TaxID=1903181 RepID=A0A1Q6DX04_METT1|nr:MAG: Ribosomal protein L5 [Candidatus Methanohalarchaeum thermophilum]
MTKTKNEMKEPEIEKVTVNIGVGSSGEDLINAENLLDEITGQEPVRTRSKQNNPTFEIKEGEPIGCKVTLRGKKAVEFLEKALEVIGNEIPEKSIDEYGNFAFGIEEHTNFPEMEYDPSVGIFGMDISVTMERPGYRVKKRSVEQKKIPEEHTLDPEDTIKYLKEQFETEVTQNE